MDELEREKIFRESATRYVDSGITSREFGQTALYGKFKRPIDETTRRDRAASQYAEACEQFFKAPIMYHDMKEYGPLKTARSVEEIEKDVDKLISKPERIQSSIITSHDFRKNISLTLTPGERSTGGHDLFAYYQLQNPIFSTLINHEFLSHDGDSTFNWIDMGILTEDIITQDSDGILLLPYSMQDSLDKNKTAFADFRYAATHSGGREAQMKDIDFLVQMSGGLENVMTTLFPPLTDERDYTESRLESQIGSNISSFYKLKGSVKKSVDDLDKIGNFYLKNDFNKNEFETLLNKLDEISQTEKLTDEAKKMFRNVYLNLCIYLKHCSVVANINILFDNNVFNRIKNYCKVIMNTNAFNKTAIQLKYLSIFVEKKEKLQQKLEEYKAYEISLDETSINEYEEYSVSESGLEQNEEKSKIEKDDETLDTDNNELKKTNNLKLTNDEIKEALTLHFKGNEFKLSVVLFKSFLKAATTDELEKKFRLSEKSIGHQYVLLVGAGAMDVNFRALNVEKRKF